MPRRTHGCVFISACDSIGLARFRAYNAASTAALAMQANLVWPILYAIGIAACVFHFANGVWTMGITWGVWVSPQAQRRADIIVSGLGVLVLLIGFSALGGFMSLNATEAEAIENRMYKESVKTGRVVPNEKKLTNPKLLEEAE